MDSRLKVFLDTSVLFSAVHSETRGARLILKLGEAGIISLWIGTWVLQEMQNVLDRKLPKSIGGFALLLDRAQIQVGEKPEMQILRQAQSMLDYLPDAQVLAEALIIKADYMVSFDREHLLVGNPQLSPLPFPVGTAGDFLVWYKERLTKEK